MVVVAETVLVDVGVCWSKLAWLLDCWPAVVGCELAGSSVNTLDNDVSKDDDEGEENPGAKVVV